MREVILVVGLEVLALILLNALPLHNNPLSADVSSPLPRMRVDGVACASLINVTDESMKDKRKSSEARPMRVADSDAEFVQRIMSDESRTLIILRGDTAEGSNNQRECIANLIMRAVQRRALGIVLPRTYTQYHASQSFPVEDFVPPWDTSASVRAFRALFDEQHFRATLRNELQLMVWDEENAKEVASMNELSMNHGVQVVNVTNVCAADSICARTASCCFGSNPRSCQAALNSMAPSRHIHSVLRELDSHVRGLLQKEYWGRCRMSPRELWRDSCEALKYVNGKKVIGMHVRSWQVDEDDVIPLLLDPMLSFILEEWSDAIDGEFIVYMAGASVEREDIRMRVSERLGAPMHRIVTKQAVGVSIVPYPFEVCGVVDFEMSLASDYFIGAGTHGSSFNAFIRLYRAMRGFDRTTFAAMSHVITSKQFRSFKAEGACASAVDCQKHAREIASPKFRAQFNDVTRGV